MSGTSLAWRPLDCHAHSTLSDGALTVAEVVERATQRGVRPSISDHISASMAAAIRDADAVRRYLDVLEQCEVMRGGEFCWHDSLWRELPDSTVRRFTHRLGSLHAIHLPGGKLVHAFSRTFPKSLTADAYMDAHVDALEQFAREMPVDILAHPTLLPLSLRERPLEELWTEEREERAVRALERSGIAFEISNRYRPHERFVRRAHQHGVRLSLGSDGHTTEQVADIAFALALTRAMGVPDDELYDPTRHGSRTGHFSPIGGVSR